MKKKKFDSAFVRGALLTLAASLACSCSQQSPAPQLQPAKPAPVLQPVEPLAPVKAPVVYQQVSFRVEMPQGFHTQVAGDPTAEAKFIKLEVKGSGATINAIGADANGFVAIGDGVISANVPVGDNLTAKVGLYTNNDPNNLPIYEVGNAFHNASATAANQITLTSPGLLVCNLVETLRNMASTELSTPINVSDYNAFSQNLLSQLPAGQTQSNVNLNDLAVKINNNTLDPNASTGTSTNPTGLIIAQLEASYLGTVKLGIFLPPAVNQLNKALFLADGGIAGVSLYSVNTNSGNVAPDSTGVKRYPQNYKISVTDLKSMAISLGSSNVNLPAPFSHPANYAAPVSYGVLTSAGNSSKLELQARAQTSGSLAWSYNFNNTNFSSATENQFVPVLKRIKGIPCLCDDEDLVMVGFAGQGGTGTGLYAVQSGALQWSYSLTPTVPAGTVAPYIFVNGALSSNGATLFALVKDSTPGTPKAFLVALKTSPTAPPAGEKLWDVQLNGSLGSKPSLALGTDGTIYLYNSQSSIAYLQAYDPSNGTRKWEKQLSGTVPNSASPIVDRQNSADIIYAATGNKLYAVNSNGSDKWATPADLGSFKPFFSPIVGEEASGRHIIYVGAFNNALAAFPYKIFAIADDKTVLWSRSPWSSTLLAGFSLLDSRLLFTTYDGGEGQFVQLQGVKVSTPNMPAAAPWPKIFGNLRNSGAPYPTSRSDDYLP